MFSFSQGFSDSRIWVRFEKILVSFRPICMVNIFWLCEALCAAERNKLSTARKLCQFKIWIRNTCVNPAKLIQQKTKLLFQQHTRKETCTTSWSACWFHLWLFWCMQGWWFKTFTQFAKTFNYFGQWIDFYEQCVNSCGVSTPWQFAVEMVGLPSSRVWMSWPAGILMICR